MSGIDPHFGAPAIEAMRKDNEAHKLFAPARTAQDAIELAYGLLWCVPVNLSTEPGRLVSMARKALLEQLDRDGQARGITAARTALSQPR